MLLNRIKQANETSNDPQFWFNKMWREGIGAFSRLIVMMFAFMLAMSYISQEQLEFEVHSKLEGWILLIAVSMVFGFFCKNTYQWYKNKNWQKWWIREENDK